LLTEVLERHYDRWVDASIPALGGQTPREAVQTAEGRPQVIELIKRISRTWKSKNAAMANPSLT
jgi:hypothetical protein